MPLTVADIDLLKEGVRVHPHKKMEEALLFEEVRTNRLSFDQMCAYFARPQASHELFKEWLAKIDPQNNKTK